MSDIGKGKGREETGYFRIPPRFLTQLITKKTLPSDSLSQSCVDALLANVSCPFQIVDFGTGEHITIGALEESCTSTCRNALSQYEASAAASCSESDVYNITEARTAPVFFIPTLLYYQFNKTCIQDDGRWCEEVMYEMSGGNGTNTMKQQQVSLDMCDDCVIKEYQFQAGSPINAGFALRNNYSSLTSSCSKTGFPLATSLLPFMQPDPTTTTTSTPTPSCTGNLYTIQPGDTCQSISKSRGVGTAWLLQDNGLQAFCADFPSKGDLCIQHHCTTYTLQANDTCKSIAVDNRLSETQLTTWNPILGPCRFISQSVGDEICISPPGNKDWTPPPSPTTTSIITSPTSAATAVPVPSNIANGTTEKCADYYYVQKGDYCNKVVLKFGISLEDFLFLNSGVNKNCTNLYAEQSYCVAPVGAINEYPGHPGYFPPASSVPTVPYSDLPKATYTPPKITGLPTTLPVAPGTRKDCHIYANGEELNIDITYSSYSSVCEALVDGWGITPDQLHNWNPSLNTNSEDCFPKEGYRYCMEAYNVPPETPPTSLSPTPTSTHSSTPTQTILPIRDGTTKNCDKYVAVVEPMTCASVLENNGITIDQFYRWNPAVGPKCRDMWLEYRYCVSGPAATVTTSTPTSTNTGGPPGPTQPGIPDNCNKWHVVKDGDSCWTLSQKYDITLEQFYKWNPAVKDDCSKGFWRDTAYCVGVAD